MQIKFDPTADLSLHHAGHTEVSLLACFTLKGSEQWMI